jgi:hypothetical protein
MKALIPQISAHSIVDPGKDVMVVEVINPWPTPINIAADVPVALVDTINPEIRDVDVPFPADEWKIPDVESNAMAEGVSSSSLDLNAFTSCLSTSSEDFLSDEVPPKDVPPAETKKPPDVEVETINETPDDEPRPIFSLDDDDDEVIMRPSTEELPPSDVDEAKEGKRLQSICWFTWMTFLSLRRMRKVISLCLKKSLMLWRGRA